MTDLDKILPKWTKKVITDSGGRDPLGLSRVSDLITNYLLTGITTTTDRARYYSFYCWALWHIAHEEKPKRFQDFVDAFQRREAVAALSTIVNNLESSPVGVRAAQAQLAKFKKNDNIACDFRVLPANKLGGYGQYYRGSLNDLRLIESDDNGIDCVTQGHGKLLADAFHTSIQDTQYIKNRSFMNNSLPFTELDEAKKKLSLDAIVQPWASNERDLLIKLFFGRLDETLGERTVMRKHTLTQILYIISEYDKNKVSVKNKRDDIDWNLIFAPHYYNVLLLGSKVKPYNCPSDFHICHSLWKQFCLQQYISQALEGLMHSILEIIGIKNNGLQLDGIISTILNPTFFSTLADATGVSCDNPSDILKVFGLDKIPNQDQCLELHKSLSVLSSLSENTLVLELTVGVPQVIAAKSILLLSVIYAKWRGIQNDFGYKHVGAHSGIELWAGQLLPTLDFWLDKKTSWIDILRYLTEAVILNQHDRIMYEKGRLDSSFLHKADDRILKDQEYGPRWRSSRHSNAISILCDLKLLKIDDEDQIHITSEGRKIIS